MTKFTKYMLAAAAVAVAAGSASAQVLQADVPFSFGGAAGHQDPGAYQITIQSSNHVVHFLNQDTKQRRMALPVALEDPQKEWRASGTPRLVFRCVEAGCELAGVWTGGDQPALKFRSAKAAGDARIAMIPLKLVSR